jgi:hypothetical protein
VRVYRQIGSILSSKLIIIHPSHKLPCLTATIPMLNWWELLIIIIEIKLIYIRVVLKYWRGKLLSTVTRRLNWSILVLFRWFLGWLWFWPDHDLFLFPFLVNLFGGNFYFYRLIYEVLSNLLILSFIQSKRVLDPVRKSIFQTSKKILSLVGRILLRLFIQFLRLVIIWVFKSYLVFLVFTLSSFNWFLQVFSNLDLTGILRRWSLFADLRRVSLILLNRHTSFVFGLYVLTIECRFDRESGSRALLNHSEVPSCPTVHIIYSLYFALVDQIFLGGVS